MPISCHFQHYKTLLVAGWVSFAESYVKLQYFVTILSLHYKVACVHTAGEVDGFNIHCSALFAAATCRIWRKFVNKFQSYIQKTIGLLFLWTRCKIMLWNIGISTWSLHQWFWPSWLLPHSSSNNNLFQIQNVYTTTSHMCSCINFSG